MDLRNILNTGDGGASKAPPPPTPGRSMSISTDHFAQPPPRMPPVQRAYSSISDLSPDSQRSILQNQPPQLVRRSPELARDMLFSQTPTSANSSPDFQRDILNPQAQSTGHPSPSDRAIRKSSTPSSQPPDVNGRQSVVIPLPAHADHDISSPEMRTSQKRKADAAFDFDPQPHRSERPSISSIGSSDTMQPHSAVGRLSATPESTYTPVIKKEPGVAFPVIEQRAKNKQKYAVPPKWAQRQPTGVRRFLAATSRSIVNGNKQHVVSRGSTPAVIPELPPQRHGGLEPNVAGVHAFYETRRAVMTFLQHCVLLAGDPAMMPDSAGATAHAVAHWEIEAKLGKLIDRVNNQRLNLGTRTETVLATNAHDIRFESGVTPQQYQRLNQYLNKETQRSQREPGRSPITYKHPKETDQFFELNQTGYLQLPSMARRIINPNHKRNMRISHDDGTGNIKAKLVKGRVADLDILRPDNDLDIRISVNVEVEFPGDVNEFINMDKSPKLQKENPARKKDRLSYSHQATQIDLTMVTAVDADPPDVKHEVEVELDNRQLLAEGGKLMAGEDNFYEEVVGQFVENTIVLVRAADEPGQPRFTI